MEPMIERIGVWIAEEIDGVQDPAASLTLNAVRPKILDWQVEDFKHGDVIIEIVDSGTLEKTTETRKELAEWKLYGIITELPTDIAADTMITRMAETIKRTLLRSNKRGQACGGLAENIDCSDVNYSIMNGGVVAEVTIQVSFWTNVKDGYTN